MFFQLKGYREIFNQVLLGFSRKKNKKSKKVSPMIPFEVDFPGFSVEFIMIPQEFSIFLH